MENRIILNFAEGNQIRDPVIRTRQQFLSDMVQFAPIALFRPVACRFRQIFRIVLAFVVMIIEEILAIQFDKGKKP